MNNTAVLRAYLYTGDDSELVSEDRISDVSFTVLRPGDDPSYPVIDGDPGSIVTDGEARYTVDPSTNTVAGSYKGFALFTYQDEGDWIQRSVPVEYDVVDMFQRSGTSPSDNAVDLAWTRFEDLFDSEQGGPWLRDMTLAHFDKDKLRIFITDVITDINIAPPTPLHYTEADFPYTTNDGDAVFAHGLVLAAIRHLMRSYVEQPQAMNSQVAYYDRRDYQQRWAAIYQIEKERWDTMLRNWKMNSYDAGSASILLGSKNGRLMNGTMRTRQVGRGWY